MDEVSVDESIPEVVRCTIILCEVGWKGTDKRGRRLGSSSLDLVLPSSGFGEIGRAHV